MTPNTSTFTIVKDEQNNLLKLLMKPCNVSVSTLPLGLYVTERILPVNKFDSGHRPVFHQEQLHGGGSASRGKSVGNISCRFAIRLKIINKQIEIRAKVHECQLRHSNACV